MIVTLELISGVSFGIQMITRQDLGEDGDGWYVLLELGIIRLIFER